MIMIKRAPAYVSKELCEGIIEYKEGYTCFSAFDFTGTKGFSLAEIKGDNIELLHAEGEDETVLDGVLRSIIAYGDDEGCKTFSFGKSFKKPEGIDKLVFKTDTNTNFSIKELFSTCNGCK